MSDSISANGAGVAGLFQINNGQVYDPAGKVFTARGIAVNPSAMGDASQILADFPGLNFVRLTIYDYQSPDTYAAFVNTMTSRGIIVEFEDHTSSDGTNGGGARGTAFTGQLLTNELNWYSSIAQTYASNPYVWFGTDNEPPYEGLSPWHRQTYDAIRNAGNHNPIMIDLPGGGFPYFQSIEAYGMDPAVYATMSNVLVDIHLYGWTAKFTPDQTIGTALADLVRGGQDMMTVDGHAPVIIGEYGISTDGEKVDANADEVLQVAQHSNLIVGAAAFRWSNTGADTLTDGQGNLNAYGKEGGTVDRLRRPACRVQQPAADRRHVSQSDIATHAASGTGIALIGGSSDPADAAAGTGSTVYVLPAAGNEPAVFATDILSSGGMLDLTNALAATDWNGALSTLPDYLAVTDTSAGAEISLAMTAGGPGRVIATIAGTADLNVDSVLAHSII